MTPMDATLEADLAGAPVGARAETSGLRLAVIVPTIGRATTVRRTIARLARQTRAPERILVVAVGPADVDGLSALATGAEIHFAPKGLCSQRNHGLRQLGAGSDLVLFFDDDFLPADDYLATAERLFLDQPDLVGATGRVIADGANGRGFSFEEAEATLVADDVVFDPEARNLPRRALYGCNMVMRLSAVGEQRFDEDLPLYGWQEDIDFSFRLGARGRLIKPLDLRGVHMGEKAGKTSGRRLGYSQIANPVHLLKKGSIPPNLALKLMRNNIASNLLGSLAPSPYIDRRGRLAGNLAALFDMARGRMSPLRILDL
jgi:glycosyltransferase involved in cell wall biosynthesis